MLSRIYIRNFAIIKEVDIDLEEGLNIISGETGTGKSIVIQAVNLALGGRGSSSLIADGSDKAMVQLVFSLSDQEKASIADKITIPDDDQLIITREFSRSGRSITKVNGEIVNLPFLNSITSRLVDIHGQYDNQTFLNSENHIRILDSFMSDKISPVKAQVASLFSQYHKHRNTLVKLRAHHSEFLRKQDFMRFELDEILKADIKPGEDEELAKQAELLQNSEKIFSALNQSYEILTSADLQRCIDLIESISSFDKEYAAISSALSENIYLLRDLSEDIRHKRDSVTFEPGQIDSVISRLDLIDKLKLKYGGSIEKIAEYADICQKELDVNENIKEREAELTAEILKIRKEILSLSEKLTLLRKESGLKLTELMTKELQELNFANAQFDIEFDTNQTSTGSPAISDNGTDKIQFLFNANKGGTLKPLADIASGGEISRISLAFKRITSDMDNISTMIFDEIDTGISGITASVVGRKMNQIAKNHQIICITHLPQIAAAGDHQFLISKNDSADRSFTTISSLSREERIREIARLLGGDNITDITLASAEELLDSFSN
ncbi:MAG: DNA repair protein RecN [Firmicutes bacterium]|nr:DNA repair protein RecN [Bacillota bacterium]